MLLFDFCSVNPFIPWFLPFALGLGLGYLLWSKYKSMVKVLENTNQDLRANLSASIDENKQLLKSKEGADNDLQQIKKKLRDIELSLSASANQLGKVDENAAASHAIKPVESDSSISSSRQELFVAEKIASLPAQEASLSAQIVNEPVELTPISSTPLVASDNLQILEGVGPKVQEILNNNGIRTFADLSTKTPSELRAILDTFGTKYRMIDVNPWVSQAGFAHKGDWDSLVLSQREIFKAKNPKAKELVDTKIEKHFMRIGILKKYNQDDLKAVEGIGPKIEQLLHADGIKTWASLAATPVSKLEAILEKAGPRYMLAKPATWPKQAGLADAGEWAQLDALQKELIGGREK